MKYFKFNILSCCLNKIKIFFILFVFSSTSLANVQSTTDVSVIKNEAMRIGNLDDFFFADNVSLAGIRTAFDDICVHATSGQYFVTLTGLYPTPNGQNFRVSDGQGNFIRYNFLWAEDKDNPDYIQVRPNEKTAIFSNADTISETCGAAGANASIQVQIRNRDFRDASIGAFHDVITVLLEAQ